MDAGLADSAVRPGIDKKQDQVTGFLFELNAMSGASFLIGSRHLNDAMYELALVFHMGSADQTCFVLEECMLAHQPFDDGRIASIRNLSGPAEKDNVKSGQFAVSAR